MRMNFCPRCGHKLEMELVGHIGRNSTLDQLQQIISLLDDEKLSIEKIACKTFTTTKNINRLFHAHLGISPSQYKRVHRFRKALTKGTHPCYTKKLAGLAADSGYYDQPNLINELKRITNLSPRKFLSAVTLFANRRVAWKME